MYGDLRVQVMDNLAVELETSGLIKEIEDEILKQK
jgi:hypothetical protein